MRAVRVTERLVQQLVAGMRLDSLAPPHSFALLGAEIGDDDRSFTYTFGPPEVSILVQPLQDSPCFAQTRCFNITHHLPPGSPPASPAVVALLHHVAASIRAVEPESVVWSRKPTLFLIPGTITENPSDLSINAVDRLRQVPTIVVEEGKTEGTRALLSAHHIPAEDKRILEVPPDRMVDLRPESLFVSVIDRMIAQEEDACLFGATEGIPGFCDPGKALIAAAAARGDRVRVRSVPGPSALAMLLMRLPFDMDAFAFLGALRDPVPSARRQYLRSLDLPVVCFVPYDPREVIARMVETCLPLGAEVLVASDLTSEAEWLVSFRPDEPPPRLPELENRRLILIVRRVEQATRVRRFRFALARVVARSALFRRSQARSSVD